MIVTLRDDAEKPLKSGTGLRDIFWDDGPLPHVRRNLMLTRRKLTLARV